MTDLGVLVTAPNFRSACTFPSMPSYRDAKRPGCAGPYPVAGRGRLFHNLWPMWWPSRRRSPDCRPAGILGGLGLALLSLGMALLAMLRAPPHVVDIVWRMAICGCGFGLNKSAHSIASITRIDGAEPKDPAPEISSSRFLESSWPQPTREELPDPISHHLAGRRREYFIPACRYLIPRVGELELIHGSE